jgi:hypothetical protein
MPLQSTIISELMMNRLNTLFSVTRYGAKDKSNSGFRCPNDSLLLGLERKLGDGYRRAAFLLAATPADAVRTFNLGIDRGVADDGCVKILRSCG